jgi:transcriptional regulator with XRE-family HTH domain
MLDMAVKEKFVELRSQGKSFASIADDLGVSKTTLIEWSKDLKEDIGNLRQIQLEAVREKYRMSAERRVELFAKQLNSVEAELDQRQLKDVPTERLFDLLMKLGRELTTNDASLTFRRYGFDLSIGTDVTWQA